MLEILFQMNLNAEEAWLNRNIELMKTELDDQKCRVCDIKGKDSVP